MGDRPLEIVALLYSASIAIARFSQDNLLLRKACNSTVAFGECTHGEANAQHEVSIINSWKASVYYGIPVVLIMLAGPWSDSHGRRRRPLILLPLVSQVLTDSLCILNVYFWEWSPEIAALYEAITPGIFGGCNMFWVGVLSYISDNCPAELRTLKYGIIYSVFNISHLVGTGLAGFINVSLGFYGAFIIPIVLNVMAILTGLIYLKDNSQAYDKNVVWLQPKSFIKSYLSVFKSGSSKYTITVISLMLCQSVLVGRISGENAVTYLYMRYKFQWYEVEYSYFSAYKLVIMSLGTYFAGSVMSIKYNMNDATIGCIACMFDVIVAIGYVVVNKASQLLLVVLVDFFHGTALSISISLSSKIISNDELGRFNSITRLFTAMISIIGVMLYSTTYHFTFEYIPGAVFFLNVLVTFPFLIMFLIINAKCKNLWTKDKTSIQSKT